MQSGSTSKIRGEPGAIVTVVYSAENEAYKRSARPAVLLPLLVILFIVSYGILTMLVFEQGQTIESQRGLIREMLRDSTQLASMKNKLSRNENAAPSESTVQADGAATPAGPKGSEAKGPAKEGKKPGKARSMKQVPGRPEADLQDVRRSTRVI
jgi:hypothetical protein